MSENQDYSWIWGMAQIIPNDHGYDVFVEGIERGVFIRSERALNLAEVLEETAKYLRRRTPDLISA